MSNSRSLWPLQLPFIDSQLMSPLGAIHTGFAIAAILCGAAILVMPKATLAHIWLGRVYVAAMLAMNGTSFFLQSFFGPFGPFHILAVISLATVAAGVLPVLLKRPKRSWLYWHYYGILLSYVGLLAATASEVTVRMIPGISTWSGFWMRVICSTGTVSVVGVFLVLYLRQVTFARLKRMPSHSAPPCHRNRIMVTLLTREFTVGTSLQSSWDHLARIEQWPSWARHIKKIELLPPGELGPRSCGLIHLTNGMKPAFQVSEFNRPRNWKWVGAFLWLTVHYDHQFEALDAKHTRLIFIIQAKGFGASVLGPLFARIYRPSLDRAIPRLVHEMNGIGAAA